AHDGVVADEMATAAEADADRVVLELVPADLCARAVDDDAGVEVARGPARAGVAANDVVLDLRDGAVRHLDAVQGAIGRVAVAADDVLADARANARVLDDDACALVGVDRVALDADARRAAAALHEDADAVRAAGRRVRDARAGDARAEDRRRDAAN